MNSFSEAVFSLRDGPYTSVLWPVGSSLTRMDQRTSRRCSFSSQFPTISSQEEGVHRSIANLQLLSMIFGLAHFEICIRNHDPSNSRLGRRKVLHLSRVPAEGLRPQETWYRSLGRRRHGTHRRVPSQALIEPPLVSAKPLGPNAQGTLMGTAA